MAMEVADSGTGFRIPVADKGRDRFEEAQLCVYYSIQRRRREEEGRGGLYGLGRSSFHQVGKLGPSSPLGPIYNLGIVFFFFSVLYILHCLASVL